MPNSFDVWQLHHAFRSAASLGPTHFHNGMHRVRHCLPQEISAAALKPTADVTVAHAVSRMVNVFPSTDAAIRLATSPRSSMQGKLNVVLTRTYSCQVVVVLSCKLAMIH